MVSSDHEYDDIREQFKDSPGAKFGFVIYRCTYKSDDDWNKFMEWLNLHVQYQLETSGIGELYSRLDWNVQEDPALEGASDEYVRGKFRAWLAETDERKQALPRHRACISVSDFEVDWIVHKDPVPPDQRIRDRVPALTLISCKDEGDHSDEDEDEDEEEWESFDPNKPLEEQMYGDSDEQYVEPSPPRDRVSSTRVGVSRLLPEAWSVLDGPGWHSVVYDNGPGLILW